MRGSSTVRLRLLLLGVHERLVRHDWELEHWRAGRGRHGDSHRCTLEMMGSVKSSASGTPRSEPEAELTSSDLVANPSEGLLGRLERFFRAVEEL